MRPEFKYKKAAAIASLAVIVAGLGAGLLIYSEGSKNTDAGAMLAVQQTEVETSVTVPQIETEAVPAETEMIQEVEATQEETSQGAETAETVREEPEPVPAEPETAKAETVKAETAKAETAKAAVADDSRIRTPEQAVPPAETPADMAAAVPVENPDENGECQPEHTQAEPEQPQGGETNPAGAVYVPGFGYVENSGSVPGETVDTDGDWNKQIGTME